MTFTATGEPSNIPPRVHLQVATGVSGATFNSLTITQDGTPIRLQPPVGVESTETYDYEMPFGSSVTYVASGNYLPFVAPDWTESWASLASWTGDTGSYSVAAGVVSSTVSEAAITRTASATIQRVEVTNPSNIAVVLLDASDEIVAFVATFNLLVPSFTQLTGNVTFDNPTVEATGSYTMTLIDGVVTATAADASWTLEQAYTGAPTKVQLFSYGGNYAETLSFTSVGPPTQLAVAASGNIYTLDVPAKLVRKFNSAGVAQTSWSTTGTPTDLALDSSENVYVLDDTNNLVRKYTSTGTAGITWASAVQGTDSGIGIDSSDGIYVLDFAASLVRKYNTSGAAGITWSVDANATRLDARGTHVVVSENDTGSSNNIERFNASGVSQISFSIGSARPSTIAVDSSGNVQFVNANPATIGSIDYYSSAGVAGTTTSISPHVPGGVAVDATSLYVADSSDSTIHKFAPATASVGTIEVTPAVAPVAFLETASVTVNITEAWLIHPAQPTLSVSVAGANWRDTGLNVDPASAQQVAARSAVTLHQPVGRTSTVAISHGNRLDEEWALVLLAPTIADRDDVRAITRDQTPLLLRSPASFGWDLTDGYYSIGDTSSDRLTQNLTSPYRRITLPLTPSDPPVVRVGVTRTWADVVTQNDTWADVVLTYETWNDLVLGIS